MLSRKENIVVIIVCGLFIVCPFISLPLILFEICNKPKIRKQSQWQSQLQ